MASVLKLRMILALKLQSENQFRILKKIFFFLFFFWLYFVACGILSSPARNGTRGPCSRSEESQPLDHQGGPLNCWAPMSSEPWLALSKMLGSFSYEDGMLIIS